jgi:hypothetical protein
MVNALETVYAVGKLINDKTIGGNPAASIPRLWRE